MLGRCPLIVAPDGGQHGGRQFALSLPCEPVAGPARTSTAWTSPPRMEVTRCPLYATLRYQRGPMILVGPLELSCTATELFRLPPLVFPPVHDGPVYLVPIPP